MQSPFTKAGIDLILNQWQQGAHVDDIVRALKADTKAYLKQNVNVYHVYSAVHGARQRGDARAVSRARPDRPTRQQNPRLIALFKRKA